MEFAATKVCHVDGAAYRYALLPDGTARIVRCETTEPVVMVPAELGGFPVLEIGEAAFSELRYIEAALCPAEVRRIGVRAFANCVRLRQLALPDAVADFDLSWIEGCRSLRTLTLPGALERFAPKGLSDCAPTRIVIGRATREFAPPSMWRNSLREVAVDARNPWLRTDGVCLYSADGRTLVSCAIRQRSVRVARGCTRIGPRAFAGERLLVSVELPEGLEQIAESAFERCGLKRIELPSSVRRIGPRAFAGCACLEAAEVGEGVLEIGTEAFVRCPHLKRLELPASVRRVGADVCAQSPLLARAGLSVSARNGCLRIGADRLLYERADDGSEAVADALDAGIEHCEVEPGAREVLPGALAGCARLARLELPESVERVGEGALRGCRVPLDVRIAGRFGAEADTAVRGAVYIESGLLCSRGTAVRYVGPDEEVPIPCEVGRIGEHAFEGCDGVRRLTLREGVSIGRGAFDFARAPQSVVVELAHPDDGGRMVVEARPVANALGRTAVSRATQGGELDVRCLFRECDRALSHMRFGFERVLGELRRLREPAFLSAEAARLFRDDLRSNLMEACGLLARNGHRADIRGLLDAGVLAPRDVPSLVDAASAAGDVATVALLLRIQAHEPDGADYSL